MFKYHVIEGKNARTEQPIWYAAPYDITPVGIELLAAQISEDTTLTAVDALSVVRAVLAKIKWHLNNGNSVRFGIFGSFRPTLRSKSTSTPEAFTANNIEKINVVYTPSSTVRYKLDVDNPNIKFVQVIHN